MQQTNEDVKELITLDDVMEELGLGPNGGLVYCMESVLFGNREVTTLGKLIIQSND